MHKILVIRLYFILYYIILYYIIFYKLYIAYTGIYDVKLINVAPEDVIIQPETCRASNGK
jgi:hypothetical protein